MRRAASALLALACALLWSGSARALEVPPLHGRINDLAGLLDASQAAALDRKLEAYERGSGHQFALLIVPSLEGDSLEDFSIRVVEEWKLGGEAEDDGILVLVAAEDRKMRIEVGYGLEGDVPDAIASRIVREVMQPAFRRGDFYGGLDQAFSYLQKAAGGESIDLPEQRVRRRRPGAASFIHWGVIGMILLLSLFGGGRGGRRRRGMYMGMGMGMGMGGGFGGGGGGGGFSGGGGGFGGGGASGGW